jgi:hypothetical protein
MENVCCLLISMEIIYCVVWHGKRFPYQVGLHEFASPYKHVLVIRCLAMVYSGFQASCHNIIKHSCKCNGNVVGGHSGLVSKVWIVFMARTLGSWVQIPLKARMYICVLFPWLCCPAYAEALRRRGSLPSSPTIYLQIRFQIKKKNSELWTTLVCLYILEEYL